MTNARTGRTRLLLGLSALAISGMAVTAAALTDSASVVVTMDGAQNRFDIVVAGDYSTTASSWTPTESSWAQGNPDHYELAVGAGQENVLSPGGWIDGRIAVKNASPRLAGMLSLSISDPVPNGTQTDPATGTYLELFDQLVFTVVDNGTTILDKIPASELETYDWAAALSPGESRVLDVRIEMSDSADNRWQLASTDIQFHFAAVTP